MHLKERSHDSHGAGSIRLILAAGFGVLSLVGLLLFVIGLVGIFPVAIVSTIIGDPKIRMLEDSAKPLDTLRLKGVAGERADFVLEGLESVYGGWAAPSGLTLVLRQVRTGAQHQLPLLPASRFDRSSITIFRGARVPKRFLIPLQFTAPALGEDSIASFTGKVAGTVEWPEPVYVNGNLSSFDVTSAEISVPVALSVRPKRHPFDVRQGASLLCLALMAVGCAITFVGFVLAKMLSPKNAAVSPGA